MFIDEMMSYFSSLKIENISTDQYREFLLQVHQAYVHTTPGIPEEFEDLKGLLSINDMTDKVLDEWGKANNTINPLYSTINKQIASLDFFKNRKYVCAAPYTTLRFDSDGHMTVCCNNTDYPIGIYPETTPLQAWQGETMKQIRNSLEKLDFSKGCMQCAKYILAGNGNNSVLRHYDDIVEDVEKHLSTEWPVYMVFQHQNICNYECIMCGGKFSTLIAKNRDKKPHINRYNSDEFLEHLKPFIKHVKTFEFLGGEPFLIPQHYKIWDLIKIENPQARVSMISNGSIYNSKVETILKELPNSIVHVSLDAVTPEIYSYIRRNGNIDTVKENIKKFKSLNRLGSISVCPMIQNIRDIPNVINFCQEIGVDIWFNDVQQALGHMWKDLYETGCMERETPSDTAIDVEKIKEFRLWTLPKQELQDHIDYLKGYNVPDRYKDRMNSFINYLGNYVSNIKSS